MVINRVFLAGLLFFLVIISLNFVSSLTIYSFVPDQLNRTVNTIVNITINNTDITTNITKITITLPFEATYYPSSNATNAADSNFSYTATGPQTELVWANASALALINQNTTKSFFFNVSLGNLGNAVFTNFSITAVHISGADSQISKTPQVNFAFSGFTKNESGGNESNVNVTMYRVAEGNNGPPTETLDANVISGSDGSFTFPTINGSASIYKLNMVRYGPGNGCLFINASCNATKIGPSIPYFPANMFYPMVIGNPAFEFMRPPSLNGTNFYMQSATTLRLIASNNSNSQKFGYSVVDQSVGFPTASNFMTSVSTVDIVVPTARNYSVMFTRFSGGAGVGFEFSQSCNGAFMNDSLCPSPPITNSTLGTLVAGETLIVNQSLIIGNYRLTGCIIPTGNLSAVNITAISLKMIPWGLGTNAFPWFMPPIKADRGDLNITTDINYTAIAIGCSFSSYNISVMGSASGMKYILEIYAKNDSREAGVGGQFLAAFQNITITDADKVYNLTLYPLAGKFYSTSSRGVSFNATQFKINIQNSTGGVISNNMNANVKVKHPVFGVMNYIIESMTSGSFYLPILNNSNWAKIMIYAQDSPPKEITLNLSLAENNITLVTMTDGSGVGMKRINASGKMEMINSTQLNATMAVQMRFLRNSAACNVLEPASSCVLTSMQAKNFNPLTALVAGKINMEMKITSTNVTLMFMNFDMFSAKQPPMDSIINDQASSGASSNSQTWQFGSFAPSNTYEYVVITMPYSDSSINESRDINLSTPLLYDENWNIIWNASKGDTSANLTDDFLDYNSSSLYRGYLSTGGVACEKSDPALTTTPCFINTTTNMAYMRIPHFSGLGPGVAGYAPVAASTSTSTSSSGSAIIDNFWTSTFTISNDDFVKGVTKNLYYRNRLGIMINSTTHYVGIVGLTSSQATINVSSAPQQAVFNFGDEKKFELSNDSYYDISVKLNNISNSLLANITVRYIQEKIPAVVIAPPVQNQTNQNNTSGNQSTETESGFMQRLKSAWVWIVIVVVLLAGLLVARYYHIKRRYYHKGI